MENEDSTSNDVMAFPDQNNFIANVSSNRDVQPTKTKVSAFKARVLKMIIMYAQHSQNLGPLLKSLSQQVFLKEPEKLHQIVCQILNRQDISEQSLLELLQMYKTCLLFKAKNKDQIDKFSQIFIKIFKRVKQGDHILQQMLQTTILKRNCKLSTNFFFFLTRKIPQKKSLILKKCSQIESNHKFRPAQLKQLHKMTSKLSKKSNVVKKQQIIE